MKKMNLIFVIHSHQPVGNFDSVFEEGYKVSYLPFLDVLEKHPDIRCALHYTGPVLDWLEKKHPEFLDRIKSLSDKGQVEVVSGGYYEPILTLLREEDALGQIGKMNGYIQRKFGILPSGAWLAERIWEPKIPAILNKAGIRYTLVDDSHFAIVGKDAEALNGYYTSEDSGLSVSVFPISEKLRYLIPFKLPNEVIGYLRKKYDEGFDCLTYGDDGEKFGMWPGTFKWVFEERWLHNFFEAIEQNSEWLATMLPREYIATRPPAGTIYIPCVSYREMVEWSGGYFRNFLVKYPESNYMHKRMLDLSRRLAESHNEEALNRLYMSQCNCGYWHGVFGGLYLNHLRSAVFQNILAAEKISGLDKGQNEAFDLNYDGAVEYIISNGEQKIVLKGSGEALEWSYYPFFLNISNVLTRRKEKYHEKLTAKKSNKNGKNGGGPVSIHDANWHKVRDINLLQYDSDDRASFKAYFIKSGADANQMCSQAHRLEQNISINKAEIANGEGAFSNIVSFDLDGGRNIALKRDLSLEGNKVNLSLAPISNNLDEGFDGLFALEINLSLFDPELSKGKTDKGRFNHYIFRDVWYNLEIGIASNSEFALHSYPVITISDSESGLEETYQGVCVIMAYSMADLMKGIRLSFSLGNG